MVALCSHPKLNQVDESQGPKIKEKAFQKVLDMQLRPDIVDRAPQHYHANQARTWTAFHTQHVESRFAPDCAKVFFLSDPRVAPCSIKSSFANSWSPFCPKRTSSGLFAMSSPNPLTTQRLQRPVLHASLEPLVTFQVCEFLVIKFPLFLSAKFRGKLGQAHPGLGNQA